MFPSLMCDVVGRVIGTKGAVVQLLQMETKTRIIAVSSTASSNGNAADSSRTNANNHNSAASSSSSGPATASDTAVNSSSLWTPIVIVGEPDCCSQAYNRIVKLVDGT